MPATHKMVNGVEVPLTAGEIAAIEAEWADYEPGTGVKWLADQAAVITTVRDQAKAAFADVDPDLSPILRGLRGILALLLQDRNLLAGRLNAILDAIDNGANLAGVKTLAAAITDAPIYTSAQVKQAVRNEIDGDA